MARLRLLAAPILLPILLGFAKCKLVFASQQQLDLQSYISTLDRFSVEVGHLADHPEQAAAIEKQLPPSWPVQADGQSFSVSTDWLRRQLAAITQHPDHAGNTTKVIQIRLRLMQSEAQNLEMARSVPLGVARNQLQGILSRREFRSAQKESWFSNLKDRVNAAIQRFWQRIFSRLGSHPVIADFLIWALGVFFVLLIMLLLVRAILRPARFRGLGLEAPRAEPATWRDFARQGLHAAAQNDFRNAVRLAYWTGVHWLENLGVLETRTDCTHREYLRLLPQDYAQRATFCHLTSDFERVWYGGQTASSKDFDSVVAQLELLGCRFQ